jgi:hypothetical protein
VKNEKCKSQNKSFFKKSLLKLDTLRFILFFKGHAPEMIGEKSKNRKAFYIPTMMYVVT